MTDLPLTTQGKSNAGKLGERLGGMSFARVFTSPLQHASVTCELAGFGRVAITDRDLVEWNYGRYDCLRTVEIRMEQADWHLFRDGCPGGETPFEVGARADRVIRRVREVQGDVLIFSSAHFLRVFTARWLGLEPAAGALFVLDTASLSALSYEHDRSQPAITLWNDIHHLMHH